MEKVGNQKTKNDTIKVLKVTTNLEFHMQRKYRNKVKQTF